jgi:ribosomal protein S18 acetylase RimI-like enzyme
MNIRRATPDDAQALARIHIDSWRSAYRGLVPDAHLDGLNYEGEAQRLRHALAAGTEEAYCVEEEGRLLAFLTLGASRDPDADPRLTGGIWATYVAPQHGRKGIGWALCRYAEGILTSRGYLHATLCLQCLPHHLGIDGHQRSQDLLPCFDAGAGWVTQHAEG